MAAAAHRPLPNFCGQNLQCRKIENSHRRKNGTYLHMLNAAVVEVVAGAEVVVVAGADTVTESMGIIEVGVQVMVNVVSDRTSDIWLYGSPVRVIAPASKAIVPALAPAVKDMDGTAIMMGEVDKLPGVGNVYAADC